MTEVQIPVEVLMAIFVTVGAAVVAFLGWLGIKVVENQATIAELRERIAALQGDVSRMMRRLIGDAT